MSEWKAPELIGAGLAALAGLAVSVKKMAKGWSSDSAETEVIDMLRAEVTRLSAQNATMAEKLNALQTELIKLNGELARMTIENNTLHAEVARLTREVTRLQHVMPGAPTP